VRAAGRIPVGPAGARLRSLVGWQFASELSRVSGRPVFDRTGLNGFFYVNLVRFQDPRVASAFNDIPPLFTALQTDLGLRLDPREEPFEVLVIDRVEQPAPD
jgi:uncharacterized protein (TIGR03435 family)